jgi:hypothetical protein
MPMLKPKRAYEPTWEDDGLRSLMERMYSVE